MDDLTPHQTRSIVEDRLATNAHLLDLGDGRALAVGS